MVDEPQANLISYHTTQNPNTGEKYDGVGQPNCIGRYSSVFATVDSERKNRIVNQKYGGGQSGKLNSSLVGLVKFGVNFVDIFNGFLLVPCLN